MNPETFASNIKSGDVQITSAWLDSGDTELSLIRYETYQKRTVVGLISTQTISIYPEASIVDYDAKPDAKPTVVDFTNLPKDWEIIMAWGERYSFVVLLGVRKAEAIQLSFAMENAP